jgi:hypothetical protein
VILRKKIGECLIQAGLITDEDLRFALAEQARTGERVGTVLVRLNYVSEKQITKALAYQSGYAYISLSDDPPDRAATAIIPKPLARRLECVAIKLDRGVVTVAVCDPLNIGVIEEVKRQTGYEVRLMIATKTDIIESIEAAHVEKSAPVPAPLASEAVAVEAAGIVDASTAQIGVATHGGAARLASIERGTAPIVDLLELIVSHPEILSQAIEESQQTSDPDRLTIGGVKRIVADVRRLIAVRRGDLAAIEAAMTSRGDDELEGVQAGISAAEELLRVLSRFRERAKPCPACRAQVALDFNACPHCGHRLRDGCSRCARPMDPDWSFCPHCAAAAPHNRPMLKERSALDSPASNVAEFKNQNR